MQWPPFGLGGIIAIVVLVLCVVFLSIGHMTPLVAGLIAALAIARLT